MEGHSKPFNTNNILEAQRLELALESAGVGTWEFDTVTNRVQWCHRAKKLFGFSGDDILDFQRILDLVYPDDRASLVTKFQNALNEESPFSLELRTAKNDQGKYSWLLCKGQSHLDPDTGSLRLLGTFIDITHEVETRHLLRQEQQHARSFQTIVEQAPMAIGLLMGPELVIELGNEKIFEVWGKDTSVTGMPLTEALPEIKDQAFPELLQNVYRSGIPYFGSSSLARLKRNGRLEDVYFDFVYAPLRGESGEVTGIMVLANEVTQYQNTLKELEASEAKFKALIEQAPVATCLFVGKDMVVELANRPMIGYWGKDESVIGKPLKEALPELVGQPFLDILDQILETGVAYSSENAAVDIEVDGKISTYYFNFTYKPIFDSKGEIYGIINMSIDVTDRVTVEKQIQESQMQLLASFEQSPVGIAIFDKEDLTFQMANPFYGYLVGRNPDEIIGKSLFEALIPFAEAAPHYATALESVARDGTPFFANEVPVTLLRDGKEDQIYVTFAYVPLNDTLGKVRKIVVWVIENTQQVVQRKKIEEIVQERTRELSIANKFLSESNELLEHSNDNLERFAYVASHDLQEPLRKIQQFASLLRPRLAGSDDKQAMYLDKMQSATERMSILIRDLLDFSKISHQRASVVPVFLNQVVSRVVVTLEQIVTESKAEITIETLPEIMADPMQMDQLFQNLLSNALKFRKPDQAPIITVRAEKILLEDLPTHVIPARQHAQYYRVDVADNGIGFDEQYLTRIFQMFQRLHGRSEFAGTGIGLAIAEKVVINHGGALTAKSQPGIGSTFSVFLPILEGSETSL